VLDCSVTRKSPPPIHNNPNIFSFLPEMFPPLEKELGVRLPYGKVDRLRAVFFKDIHGLPPVSFPLEYGVE